MTKFENQKTTRCSSDAQRTRPGEDVTPWENFFFRFSKKYTATVTGKIKEKKEQREAIGIREQHIYAMVENTPGISSGDIVQKLKIPPSTVKQILADLVAKRNLVVHGAGRGTSYSIATTDLIKRGLADSVDK